MEQNRVEFIARALCRSAGFDPDQTLSPDTQQVPMGSMSPALVPLPAWQRFCGAAQAYCDTRDYLAGPAQHRRLSGSSSG